MIFKRVANERKSSFAARFYFYDAMKKCVAYQRKCAIIVNTINLQQEVIA